MPWWAWALIGWFVLGGVGAYGVAAVLRRMNDAQGDRDLEDPRGDPSGPPDR